MHFITADSAPRFDLPALSSPDTRLRAAAARTCAHGELVTSGTISLSPDSQALTAGDCAIVPAGSPIVLSNPGEHAATAHVLIRAGFTAKMADGSAVPTPPWAR